LDPRFQGPRFQGPRFQGPRVSGSPRSGGAAAVAPHRAVLALWLMLRQMTGLTIPVRPPMRKRGIGSGRLRTALLAATTAPVPQ